MSYNRKNQKCVIGCADLGSYMHRFPHPVKRHEMFKKWVSIIPKQLEETDPMKIFKSKKICDYHFSSEHKVASHRLLDSAVPSLELDGIFVTPALFVQLEHNYCVPRIYGTSSNPNEGTDSLAELNSSESGIHEASPALLELINQPSITQIIASNEHESVYENYKTAKQKQIRI